jgi:arylsulfatase A-like enzyme
MVTARFVLSRTVKILSFIVVIAVAIIVVTTQTSKVEPAEEVVLQAPPQPQPEEKEEEPVRKLLPLDMERKEDAQQIFLIVLDTVRADHLGVYGYERETTPSLQRLSRSATKYRQAYAAAPWTLPSHASMLTGLYPFEHGARTLSGAVKDVAVGRGVGALPSDIPTIPELLGDAGYATGAIIANSVYLRRLYGLDRGFAQYNVEPGSVEQINERVFTWLKRHKDEPFFLMINYMDAHRPYNVTPREGFPTFEDPNISSQLLDELYPIILNGDEPSNEKLTQLIDAYDLAIANLDEGLGDLFAKLRKQEMYDDSLIIVTSDHGEFFGEHGLLEHSKDVYEPVVEIPLLVKSPKQTEKVIDEHLISHVHIPGIILQHTALWGTASAEPFLKNWQRNSIVTENYYSRMRDLKSEWGSRFQRERRAVYSDQFKYIQSSDGEHEMYNLKADKEEGESLYVERPRHVERLEGVRVGMLTEEAYRKPIAPADPVKEDHQKALVELGYLGADDTEPSQELPTAD